jgi:AcrR family transcriptional regulator
MKKSNALNPTAELLLKTAEQLLAEKGLGAVSTREIARQAGQKNNSAISYHFGSMQNLLEAILDYRMTPLNQSRRAMLDTAINNGDDKNLRSLVEVIVKPLTEELLRPPEHSRYLSLLSQLISTGQWQTVFTQHEHRASALLETGDRIMKLLRASHSEQIALERIRLMGLHTLSTISEWDALRRRGELQFNRDTLPWRLENLVDYLVGALSASSAH